MTPFNLSNAALFQITWFACVIGGAADEALWGMVCAGIMLGLAQRTPYLRSDMWLLGICLIAGFALDTLWIQTGVLDYRDAAVAPGWILALWMGAALTINHSLGWLRERRGLGALLAGGAAPLTYLAGERLGAVTVVDAQWLGAIAVSWAVLFGALFSIARYHSRALERRSAAEGVGFDGHYGGTTP